MKNPMYLITAFVMSACLSASLFAQQTTITLVHMGDTHSHLDAVGPKDANLNGTLGGLAKAATVIGTLRMTEPNVILLHGGDLFQGDFFFNEYYGVPELQIMKQLGFDAMTVGNHDLGYTAPVLYGAISTAFVDSGFPILSANLDMSAYPDLQTWVSPFTIKSVDNVQVGIFGMTVPDDPTAFPDPVVILPDLEAIASQTVSTLQAAGADVIVLLSHLGYLRDQQLAATVPGIDFIMGAHDHFLFEQPVSIPNPAGKQTLIVQAGSRYQNIGQLTFTVNEAGVTTSRYEAIAVDASVTAEPTIQGVVDLLKAGIVVKFGDVYHTPIATATHDLDFLFDPSTPIRDTPLGNLVTDAFRTTTQTQIAMTASGLISEKIYAGPIVGADVFRSMSYGLDPATGLGFTLATFDIKGSELMKGLELGLAQVEYAQDLFIQVSGMTYDYNLRRRPGSRVIPGSIRVGGQPFHTQQYYSCTVNSGIAYLLNTLGLQVDHLTMLPNYEYEVVRDYVTGLQTVDYEAEGRIRDLARIGAVTPRNESPRLGLSAFPNPFNPTTTITYSTPNEARVSLKIYNCLGQEVANLVDGTRPAGTHSVEWNGLDFASGLYFYRLQVGSHSETRKIILAK